MIQYVYPLFLERLTLPIFYKTSTLCHIILKLALAPLRFQPQPIKNQYFIMHWLHPILSLRPVFYPKNICIYNSLYIQAQYLGHFHFFIENIITLNFLLVFSVLVFLYANSEKVIQSYFNEYQHILRVEDESFVILYK